MSDQSTTPKSAGHDTPRSGGGFTPGPLIVWHQPPDCRTNDGLDWSIQTEEMADVVALVALGPIGTRADLQLWAAAPDLLESMRPACLEIAADLLEGRGLTLPATVLRRLAQDQHAAISKALGTSPEGLASMAMGGGDSTESQSQPCGEEGPTASLPPAQHFDGKES